MSNDPGITAIPVSYSYTHSPSTATMSSNSSILMEFTNNTKSTSISSATSTAYLTSEMPDKLSCKKPVSYVSAFTLSIVWHVVYWTSQALTWFALHLCFIVIVISKK